MNITGPQGRVLAIMKDGYELGITSSSNLPRTAWLTKSGEISVKVQFITVDCLAARKLIQRRRTWRVGIATYRTVYKLTKKGLHHEASVPG